MINGCSSQIPVMMSHETFDTSPSSCLALITYEKSEIEKTIKSFNTLKKSNLLSQYTINREYRQQRIPFIVPTNLLTDFFGNYGDFFKIVIAILKQEIVINPPLSIQCMVNGVLWLGCIDSNIGEQLFELIDKTINLTREDRTKWNAVKYEVKAKVCITLPIHHEQSSDVLIHLGTRLEGCDDFLEFNDDIKIAINKAFHKKFRQRDWPSVEAYIEMLFCNKQFPIQLKKEVFTELEKDILISTPSTIESTLFFFLLSLEANKVQGNEKAIKCLDCCLKWIFIQDEKFFLEIYQTLISQHSANQKEVRPKVIRSVICSRIEALGFVKMKQESISVAIKPEVQSSFLEREHVVSTQKNSRTSFSPEQYQKAVEQQWEAVEELLNLEDLMKTWFKAKGVIDERHFHDIEADQRKIRLQILASLLKKEPKRNKLFLEALHADVANKNSQKISQAIESSLAALMT